MLQIIEGLDMDEKRYRLLFSYDNIYGIFRSRSCMPFAKASADYEICELREHTSSSLDDVLKDIMLMYRTGKSGLRINDVVCVKINGMNSCLRFAGVKNADLENAAGNFRDIENFLWEEYSKNIEQIHRQTGVLSVLDGKILDIGEINVNCTLYAIDTEVFCADREAVRGVRSEFSLYSLRPGGRIKNVNPYGRPFFAVKNAICYYTWMQQRKGETMLLLNRQELELVQDYHELKRLTGGNDMTQLGKEICEIYGSEKSSLLITPRIMEGLLRVITGELEDLQQMDVKDFLLKESTLSFVENHQPDLAVIPEEVIGHIQTYFGENLSAYTVAAIYRHSNHLDDHKLYCVIGQKSDDGTYACWTSWSEALQSLNHGHYGLKSFDIAEKILKENFVDITGDIEKYGMNKTKTVITDKKKRDMDMQQMVSQADSWNENIVPFRRKRAGR